MLFLKANFKLPWKKSFYKKWAKSLLQNHRPSKLEKPLKNSRSWFIIKKQSVLIYHKKQSHCTDDVVRKVQKIDIALSWSKEKRHRYFITMKNTPLLKSIRLHVYIQFKYLSIPLIDPHTLRWPWWKLWYSDHFRK